MIVPCEDDKCDDVTEDRSCLCDIHKQAHKSRCDAIDYFRAEEKRGRTIMLIAQRELRELNNK